MRVLVRYFAVARERSGQTEEWWDLESGATVEQLWSRVVGQHPSLASLADCLSYAVNREYVDRSHPLAEGDEVALIPPVSGG